MVSVRIVLLNDQTLLQKGVLEGPKFNKKLGFVGPTPGYILTSEAGHLAIKWAQTRHDGPISGHRGPVPGRREPISVLRGEGPTPDTRQLSISLKWQIVWLSG